MRNGREAAGRRRDEATAGVEFGPERGARERGPRGARNALASDFLSPILAAFQMIPVNPSPRWMMVGKRSLRYVLVQMRSRTTAETQTSDTLSERTGLARRGRLAHDASVLAIHGRARLARRI